MGCNKFEMFLLLALLSGCTSEEDCRALLNCVTSTSASSGDDADASVGGEDSRGDAGTTMNTGATDASAAGGGHGGLNGDGGDGGEAGGASVGTDGDDDVVVCGDTPVTGCVPSATNAVFVRASAPAGGDGSLASPFRSIAVALTAAANSGATDIYICAGTYDEKLVIANNEAGIDLHGGFDCNGFTYDATAIPFVSPSTPGYALHIDAVTSPILIEDLSFIAISANIPGESSIAAFVSESTNVTFDRCHSTAGTGMTGDDGVTEDFVEGATVGVNWPVLSTLEGNDGDAFDGGAVKGPIMCPAGDSSFGGEGGDQLPTDGRPGGPGERGGSGGQVDSGGAGGPGFPGEFGPDGSNGQGSASAGTLTSDGFTPYAGGDGEPGQVGGGGGGGAGSSATGGYGGGSGGAGGCGGNFGPGGQGGGASIALLAYNSILIVRDSSLTSTHAGNGGRGDAGQEGQHVEGTLPLASLGGIGPGAACDGGEGAAGGSGGSGGGGAGGISVGVLWSGTTAPIIDQATNITVGTAGLAGLGAGIDNDGAAGFAEEIRGL
jgi:hypothetical protein